MGIPQPSRWLVPGVLLVTALAIAWTPWGRRADLAVYDLAVRASSISPSDDVIVVAIDEPSLKALGEGVWKPATHADLLDRLIGAGVRAIGYVQFAPQRSTASDGLRQVRERLQQLPAELQPQLSGALEAVEIVEREAGQWERLRKRIEGSNNVVLPLAAGAGLSAGKSPVAVGLAGLPVTGSNVGYGHVQVIAEVDGVVRRLPVVVPAAGERGLALTLEVLGRAGLDLHDRFRTAPDGNVWLRITSAGLAGIRTIPLWEVQSGRIAPQTLRDKIVLIGPTAGDEATVVRVSGEGLAPLISVQALGLSNLLRGEYVARSWWSDALGAALCALAFVLALFAKRISARRVLILAPMLALSILCVQALLLTVFGLWMPGVAAACLFAIMPLALILEPRMGGRPPVQTFSGAQGDDRLLALAFHEQGRLDLAFDHLRKCVPSEAVLDDLYELGLDFERRRQYAKAQQVFDYVGAHSPQRRELLKRQAPRQDAASPAAAPVAQNRDAVPASSALPKRLGRYELGRELGRGAMGVVYLGKDTTIGRAVALKTMPLSQEFEAAELDTVKRRFFGEAESAGRLNHPNIVTIYDAGEDQDLAYIAMELLTGRDLSRFTPANRLLPLATVLNVVARVADALDYAHRLNIVHRDIKPGNIMYDPKTDAVKVTDFGIARITDSNKTKTGMVLGTPSFMSPEQLAGKKIDGQSDIYSLGVTLYQLACGSLPFQAASLAQLMFKISNEQPTDPLSHNPSLPDDLVQVIGKALAKDKSQRFATGSDMAIALRGCAANLAAVDIAL